MRALSENSWTRSGACDRTHRRRFGEVVFEDLSLSSNINTSPQEEKKDNLKKRAISRVGIFASALMVATATLNSQSAIAAETAQLLSNVSPDIEAAEIADALEGGRAIDAGDDVAAIASYEVRFSTSQSTGPASAVFPLPDGCKPSTAVGDLACSIGEVSVQPVAVSSDGRRSM